MSTAPRPLLELHARHRTVADSEVDIRGRRVESREGEDLGRVEELLVDSVEDRVRMLRIEQGGVFGLGATSWLIPVEAVTEVTGELVRVDITDGELAAAPVYDPEVVPDPAHYLPLYDHFGFAPFWV